MLVILREPQATEESQRRDSSLRCAQNDKGTTKKPMVFSIKFSNFLK